MNTANTNAIEVIKLKKQFGDFVSVKEVSFTVYAGEILGLLGPNGAGKTTLIRMMTTLTPPTSGTALVAGHNVETDPDGVRNAIGVIPQALTSDPELTARENVMIHAKLYSVPSANRQELVSRLLESVKLSEFADKLVGSFSGGMRRRLEIARGLVHSPKILFLDEPTTGLDPVSRSSVWEMINKLKEESGLTILLTTHYMDEADRLCDRIAIVDHGQLVALDTPTKLKDSVPGTDIVEAEFDNPPADWHASLEKLTGAASVSEHDGVTHISSHSGPLTVGALMNLARDRGVTVRRVSVQGTTLDDVFLYYTGRQLRDAAAGSDAARRQSPLQIGDEYERMKLERIMAIIERDMRKFFRSPALMMTSMIFPLMQLIVLGYAFGGKIKGVKVAMVDQDHTSASREVEQRLGSVEVGPASMNLTNYSSLSDAILDLRTGFVRAVIYIPPDYSRRVDQGNRPRIAFIEDNTDTFVTSEVLSRMQLLVQDLNSSLNPFQPGQPLSVSPPRLDPLIDLQQIELYPYIEYIKYLLAGSIAMSVFIVAMIGGGITFIDDKSRGLHEGYLVTPIKKTELILGLILSGAIKGLMSGISITIIGGLIAGISHLWDPVRLFYLAIVLVCTSMAMISFMFLLMVRVSDPLVPRAMFGVLNTLLYFPSGAIYPVEGFPHWLRWISYIDPFTYAVHALKALLLKDTGLPGIYSDVTVLVAFSAVLVTLSVIFFKRQI